MSKAKDLLESIRQEARQEIIGELIQVLTKMQGKGGKKKAPTDGPGRGKKQCPVCKEYRGVRTRHCNCGHVFVKTPKAAKKTASRKK